jgi:FkbM family methyltransferase
MSIMRYAKLLLEFVVQIKNYSLLKKDMEMSAFDLKLTGQGHMIQAYSSMNHQEFLTSLKREVDFIKSYNNREYVEIIDAGANLGFYSVVYAMNDHTKVTSFEPFPETYKHLENNIKRNHITNITTLKLGLFSSNLEMPIGSPLAFNFYGFLQQILKFTDWDQTGCKSVYTTGKNTAMAKFIRGDVCRYLTLKKHIDFIKIDVEGAELEVLKGLENLIKKHQPLLKIEFNLAAFSSANITCKDIWDYLIELGYTKYTIPSRINKLSDWLSIENMPVFKGAKDILFY